MDEQAVWSLLSGIPIGTIVAWVMVIAAIIAVICAGTVKLYKVFAKYKELKDKNDENVRLLHNHDDVLNEIKESLLSIQSSMEEERDVSKRRLKHDITKISNQALKDGTITLSMLQSLEEEFEDYVDVYHGNSWAETLVRKVRRLPVVEDLDDDQ